MVMKVFTLLHMLFTINLKLVKGIPYKMCDFDIHINQTYIICTIWIDKCVKRDILLISLILSSHYAFCYLCLHSS